MMGYSLKRAATALGIAATMVIAGSSTAQAYRWASRSEPLKVSQDGHVQGKGAGTFKKTAYNRATLHSSLKDSRAGHGRTFANSAASEIATKPRNFQVQSNRRADGHNWWATMADESHSIYGYMVGFTGHSKVCQDISFKPDPCSRVVNKALTI